MRILADSYPNYRTAVMAGYGQRALERKFLKCRPYAPGLCRRRKNSACSPNGSRQDRDLAMLAHSGCYTPAYFTMEQTTNTGGGNRRGTYLICVAENAIIPQDQEPYLKRKKSWKRAKRRLCNGSSRSAQERKQRRQKMLEFTRMLERNTELLMILTRSCGTRLWR